VTKKSIAELRRDKSLPEKLKKALGTRDHFLALDVISTLRMRELVPALLAFAERDRTGYSYHALNGLIDQKDEERVTKLYVERLANEKTSLASKMALLDTVGRFGTEIPTDVLNHLLVKDTAEVRSAALYYVRNGILSRRRQELYPFLKSAAQDPTFQIRMQALYLVSEIPLEERQSRADLFNSLFETCAQDANALVKSLCTDIAAATWEKKK
jgi:HEAT repeat protein